MTCALKRLCDDGHTKHACVIKLIGLIILMDTLSSTVHDHVG